MGLGFSSRVLQYPYVAYLHSIPRSKEINSPVFCSISIYSSSFTLTVYTLKQDNLIINLVELLHGENFEIQQYDYGGSRKEKAIDGDIKFMMSNT